MDPDNPNAKPFMIISLYGIFLLSKNDLFINANDLENK